MNGWVQEREQVEEEEDVQDEEEHEPKEDEQLGEEVEEDKSRGKRMRRKGRARVGIA